MRMFHQIIHVCKALHERLRTGLEPHGLHRGQARIVHLLGLHDSMSQVAIAQQLMLRRATVTRMLQRMERAGLVARFPDPRDNRVQRVRLTPAGIKAQEVFHLARQTIESAIAGALTAKEQADAVAFLQRITRALRADDPADGASADRDMADG